MTAELNIQQEHELYRLIDYERSICNNESETAYRCFFPFRPEEDLQAELIDKGMLRTKTDGTYGNVVTITSTGYSYFGEMQRAEAKQRQETEERRQHETNLAMRTGIVSAACMCIGFILAFIMFHFV